MGCDFSVPNDKPGTCAKCNGSGQFAMRGPVVHSVATVKHGTCWSCRGTGHQTYRQIKRNECYNRHKVVYL